jgi:thiosulfate/3-mercaptopyruvate sulfurtransferase
MPAARVLWALAYYGHRHTAVLTGGSDRWQEEGHPWTADPAPPRTATFTVRLDESHLADRDWLLNHARDADIVLVDTRAVGEYAAGHLPGAVGWDWINGVPVGSWDTVRPAAELQAELVESGITPDKEIVTYCQSGVRAAHTYLLLRHLGYRRVRVYDGSWLDWSRHADESGAIYVGGENDGKS